MTDREWDKKLNIATMGREDETGTRSMPYEPTPYAVLERLAGSGLIGADSHVLDYGCGKGRAALFLAARTGCRATGIDHSEKLIAMAEENRRRFIGADRVRFMCRAAEAYPVGDEDVFFFFNPFSEAVLRVALARILDAWYRCPRPMRLLFYYPSDAYIACLMTAPELLFAGEIDCRDLFDGDNPRERISVFEIPGSLLSV